MNTHSLTAGLKDEAHRLGFDLVGVCRAVTPPQLDEFRRWIDSGYAGRMDYMVDRAEAYQHPRHVLDGVSSIVMLGVNYRTAEPAPVSPGQGVLSRYAWGTDYHDLIRDRLHSLADFHRQQAPAAGVRGVVDTAPLAEREFAQLAGLGWIGKNTMLINRKLGSWLFLAALLTTEELEPDEPTETDRCGTCRACLDACPTEALIDAYQCDARRCISYLTIELRESIPAELRSPIGDRLFGCDACQEVCPWNRQTPVANEPGFQPAPELNPVDPLALFALDDEQFRKRFRHTPLWRGRRRAILRNAAIVLGNDPTAEALPVLAGGLEDSEPLVRAACAWALGQYADNAGRADLERRLPVESDPEVLAEINVALNC